MTGMMTMRIGTMSCEGQAVGADHRAIASDDRQQRLPERRTVKDHVQIGTGKVWGTLLA